MATTTDHADARQRSVRTIAQGLVSTLLVALASVVVDQVTPGEIVTWATLAVAGGTAMATAGLAYLHRVVGGAPARSAE
jgi:hypothetical protein